MLCFREIPRTWGFFKHEVPSRQAELTGKLAECLIGIISEQSEQFLSAGPVADYPELGRSADHDAVLPKLVALFGANRLCPIQSVPLEPLRRVIAAVTKGLDPGQVGVFLGARGPLGDVAGRL